MSLKYDLEVVRNRELEADLQRVTKELSDFKLDFEFNASKKAEALMEVKDQQRRLSIAENELLRVKKQMAETNNEFSDLMIKHKHTEYQLHEYKGDAEVGIVCLILWVSNATAKHKKNSQTLYKKHTLTRIFI